MINSAPRSNGKYKQGLFIPKNIHKVIKLNAKGGVYYRSGLEEKFMIYLDSNDAIKAWSAEYIKIPYQKTYFNNNSGEMETTSHTYYPDFYYELIRADGTISRVVAEVKPHSQTIEPVLKENMTTRQLKSFEYNLKEWNRNLSKWKYMIDYSLRKGIEFIIITEQTLQRR